MSNERRPDSNPAKLRPMVGRGDVVTVRRGAAVRSLHPNRGRYVTQRAQKVKVDRVTTAFVLDGVEHPAEVSWAGRGGYWCYAALTDVTPIDAPVIATNANGNRHG